MDDGIISRSDDTQITKFIQELQRHKLKLQEIGNLQEYLGVNATKINNKTCTLTQNHLIENVIKQVDFKSKPKPTSKPKSKPNILKIQKLKC